MLKTLRACSLSLLVLNSTTAIWVAAPVTTVAFSSAAEARSRSGSSYSRPSRSPSVSSPSRSTSAPPTYSRTPSVGSSYERPSRSPSVVQGFGSSASDRAYSSQRSAESLDRMRAAQDAARRAAEVPRPSPAPRAAEAPRPYSPPRAAEAPRPANTDTRRDQGGGSWAGNRDNGSRDTGSWSESWGGGSRSSRPEPRRQDPRPQPRPGNWYADRGWNPPSYATNRSFGAWDGIFLWYMLSNLSKPGHSDFFSNHRDDPGLRQWRAEADGLAVQNADVRGQLGELDRRVGEVRQTGAAPDPTYLPPGIPAEVAVAASADNRRTPSVSSGEDGGGAAWIGLIFFLILLGGIGFVGWRMFGGGNRMVGRGSVPATGNRAKGSVPDIAVRKVPAERPGARRFRLGMTLTADPTPFLLASGTKVPMPKTVLGGGLTSVTAVGRLQGEPGFVRLHLDEEGYFELHLDASGNPDECRYFGLIDTETPASQGEWEAWLKPGEGMIGWEAFETTDKAAYGRVWQPGPEWVEPRERVELVESIGGTRRVTTRSMLYAAPSGVPEPGPQAEYILVTAVEDDDGARVEIRAGIEVNPASITIP